jgi:hypothetical protein
MEEEKNVAEKWVDGAENLIETYRDLLTIRIIEKTSLGASFSILGILVLLLTLCILLFVGLGAAWWLGESMENRVAGFFIVGGAYLILLGLLLITSRKFVVPTIRNLIIKKIYDTD